MAECLQGKKILLGITAGIAAYKSAELCRLFVKAGAEVRVVMTRGAQEFIAPLTFQALSGNPVHSELLDPDAEAGMGHIELAKWPDMIVVAPATADFISKYRQGLAGDLLNTLLLASEAKVYVAPAMNQAMWSHPLTQFNVTELARLMGARLEILPPQAGEQACGDVGVGRMMEPADIFEALGARVSASKPAPKTLAGKRVVITAGPTREAIDPVRYVSNHSSGKMGYALAGVFRDAGAEVCLISGPVSIDVPLGVERIPVVSAEDMMAAVLGELEGRGCDIFVAAAAVADYRPKQVPNQKIKKTGDDFVIELVQNPDIVASVAARKDKPFTVGFAAETNDVLAYAKSKLERKGLDMIVANDVSQAGIGFNSEENEVHVLWREGSKPLPRQSKQSIAEGIVGEIVACLKPGG